MVLFAALGKNPHEAFLSEHPGALVKSASRDGKIHRDLTPDGKAHLHRYVKQNAIRNDITGVIEALKALRFYLGLK
jgi:hypothetical protein